ncbi:FapA family protein [Desulfohalovibrio reitneri]|uniref:FapA family protein n=1 Tax=Desulfohalovibrio reitneri TaxID=1307759 RepID=UPI0004A724E3|nr:FapA family protein [Desulfohalovibrio reitneri]
MPYYLEHAFNPDFDHTRLAPRENQSGRVNHFDLGYVQSVNRGQELARLRRVDEDEAAGLDQRFVLPDRTIPAGPNTEFDPSDADRLLAAASGYVFYEGGRITVKSVLNVRRDVDYHTGNITFAGDMVLHGGVRSGFRLRARNILSKSTVEGARLRARGSIVVETGVKGAEGGYLHAAKSMRLGFCENARLKAGENILVQGAAMHNEISVRGKLVVRGRLVGGVVRGGSFVYVGEQLGGGLSTSTQIVLGYDPFLLHEEEVLGGRVEELEEEMERWEALRRRGGALAEELEGRRLVRAGALEKLKARRARIWERIQAPGSLERCVVVVPGEVRPGAEISIGQAFYGVGDFMENVRFTYEDGRISVSSPALLGEEAGP